MSESIAKLENKELYKSPFVEIVHVKTRGVLCDSGDESMKEKIIGDGGFTEE